MFRELVDLLQPLLEMGDRGRLVDGAPVVHRGYFCNRREVGGTEGNVEGVEASRSTDEFEVMSPPADFGTSWRIREDGILYDILSVHDSPRNRYAVVVRGYRSQRTGSAFLGVVPGEGDVALGLQGGDSGYLLGLEPGAQAYYLGLESS
ncbi:MAG: hypothetical protein OXH70_17810 [Acidobacteria bacterium]|nr:hypothetical protein [Acidobacteriota bacterium]